MCCKSGKNADYRPRHFRARQKSSDMRRMSISSDASSAFDGKAQVESDSSDNDNIKDSVPVKKRRNSDGGDAIEIRVVGDVQQQQQQQQHHRKTAFRMQLAQQLTGGSTKILKKPMYVVRPSPVIQQMNSSGTMNNLALDKRCVIPIFKCLDKKDLYNAMQVCKLWAQYTIDPSLWKTMDFTRTRISSEILKGIVRRQPEILKLDWCHINKYQLPWLIQRLTNLKELSLISVNVKSVISLRSCQCAHLTLLDLSFITEFNDSALREILGPNNDSRRGLTDEKVRFRNLKTLRLAGTDITDIAMRYITQFLPNLENLSLSLCPRISDAGIAQLTTKPATTVMTLVSLDLSGAKLITELSLEHLGKCENLVRLDCRHASQVSTQALIKFAAKSERDLQVRDIKLVDKRQQQQNKA